ncbi:cardiolipin synthase [Levilactobacillus acidifarinae]|uniref:Cardiolipin synthase n=1 Tax=Levilactobacillus acidifarinae DSM 19394 = JCM 15949 TaxID=1423715 RepID=A0A0R1LQN2_9LACO|nr:cardiolipin synthase [Levilactobacillus acidifarinae]KRK95169.1 phosphatidylserine phosphatidylglycerophosphate cardiolipin synthase-like protein [Levilactobacillus acidifarinae DSM 19394]GEO70351.1 cardiolipin synthase [Levilactobacillus acidifarinae]
MSISAIIEAIIILNAVLAFLTVFREKRDIAATWAWMLVLVLVPIVGFIAYAFIGRKLPKGRMFRLQHQVAMQLDERLQQQRQKLGKQIMPADRISHSVINMVNMFMSTDQAFLARQNKVQVITDGHDLFRMIMEDIEQATSSVHIEFYTFYNDRIGNEILDLLVQKAKADVEVRVIYDPWGSMGTWKRFFKPLMDAGGHVEPFLGTRSAVIDFRLNFRDHRKIVTVDGRVGYVGGFNIGDQYLGRKEKFGYWRDTHLRIIGSGVFSLQARFMLDWNATDRDHPFNDQKIDSRYFPLTTVKGETSLQIVSSGPDSDLQQIKMGYMRMIQTAEKSLWIQTPYLIPDDSVLDSLRIAAMAGIDVRIMIPDKPDHAFVYRATQYYARQLANDGVKIYYYHNGFIHAKTMVVDGKLASVGSANMDYRSFKLNFEINAFVYDEQIATQLENIYKIDMTHSELITPEKFDQQSLYLKFKQTASRLLSPIL